MFQLTIKIALIFTTIYYSFSNQITESSLKPNSVVPSEKLFNYQKMELIGFIHFTVKTFTDREWGYGDENPEIFNPTELDTDQWARTAKNAGMKQLILTAKHHDGFCLWPSEFTEHSIKQSPYKNGEGDVVDEFVKSCKKYGLKAGLYLSPWDRNHELYGYPEYIVYYKNQLKELLTNYGEINEIWFDGANGGDGYYGGANEIRKIDPETYYGWDSIFYMVKQLQPNIKIFSDAGPDVHWIGNENGFAGETFWSMFNPDSITIGKSNTKYLNTGDVNGESWVVGQCDVSIRPGWFYHKSEDSLVKSPQELVDIYYKSVGRNAILLLNIPPDKRGLLHDNDIKSLTDFKNILDETFSKNLALNQEAVSSNYRNGNFGFDPQNVIDGNINSYWANYENTMPVDIIVNFSEKIEFDRILIQEPIKLGQRISEFNIEIYNNGKWQQIFEGTTVGYKRLVRVDPVVTDKMKLTFTKSNNTVAISNIGVFKSSDGEY